MDKLGKTFSVAILGAYAVLGITIAYDAYTNSDLKEKVDETISKFKKKAG